MKDFYQVSLKLFLKNTKGETLILGALPMGSYTGYYDVPGGRILDTEFRIPLVDIVKRELKEECDVTDVTIKEKPVAVGRHLVPAVQTRLNRDIHVLYLFFEATLNSGEITISKEHTSFEWVDLKSLDIEKYFKSGILEGVKMYLGR